MKKYGSEAVSKLEVLELISDRHSMNIFNAIARDVSTSDSLMKILDISPKEYYSRSTRLLDRSLIRRKDGRLILTSFGRLIYNAQLKIAIAFKHSPELRTIDAIKSYSEMPDDEQMRIIDKLLGNSELRNLVLDGSFRTCCQAITRGSGKILNNTN